MDAKPQLTNTFTYALHPALGSFHSYLCNLIRNWQSMSNWRTLCQFSRSGHRCQVIRDSHIPSRLLRPRPPSRRNYACVHASELSFGQPLHETHPHLLKAGERTTHVYRVAMRFQSSHSFQSLQALPRSNMQSAEPSWPRNYQTKQLLL